MTISGANLIPNDRHVLVQLSPAGVARISEHYRVQGLTPLYTKRNDSWRLPFWLFLELLERADNDQLFVDHLLSLAPDNEDDQPNPSWWVYHCAGCGQLVIAERTSAPKFHFFAAKTPGVSPWCDPSPVVMERRCYLVCPERRCNTKTYLALTFDQVPPTTVLTPDGSSRPYRRRARHSRPALPGTQPTGRRGRQPRQPA